MIFIYIAKALLERYKYRKTVSYSSSPKLFYLGQVLMLGLFFNRAAQRGH